MVALPVCEWQPASGAGMPAPPSVLFYEEHPHQPASSVPLFYFPEITGNHKFLTVLFYKHYRKEAE